VIIGSAQYTTSKISVIAPAPGRKLLVAGDSYSRVMADYTPQEVAELLRAGDRVQLIDVRQRHEHDAGRIAGDRLIELTDLAGEASTLDPGRPVVVYCRSGGRSAMATEALAQAGFDAHNMSGGLLEWDAAGLPLEPGDGFVAEP
jgi:rhodanese-related sulfurtransferase